MPHGSAIVALVGLVAALALSACGGSDEPSAAQGETTTSAAIIDIETIGKSEEVQWTVLADRWADTALEEANTAGELLNDRGDLRRLLNRRAPKLRDRIVQALDALGPRCRALTSEVPPPPSGFEAAAAELERACVRFERARFDLVDGLDTGDRAIVTRGERRLAGGVNAIASAKAALAPAAPTPPQETR